MAVQSHKGWFMNIGRYEICAELSRGIDLNTKESRGIEYYSTGDAREFRIKSRHTSVSITIAKQQQQ